MKKCLILFILVFAFSINAQYKKSGFPSNNIKDGIISNNSNSLFGFLNSDNFMMNHSYSLSYSSFGNNGLALGVYTNSMFYKFTNNLNVQLDASFIHSPYNSFGKEFQKNINGFYISRAAVNYRPWEDVSISVQYRNMPYSYYNPYDYYRGWNYNPFFSGDDFFSR